MKICTCREMRQAEQAVFDSGIISSDGLMDAAIAAAAATLRKDPLFADIAEKTPTAVVYAGKGKNAGDAIGIVRELGFSSIIIRAVAPVHDMAPETRRQLSLIPEGVAHVAHTAPELPPGGALLIDGLLGSGAHGPLRPELATLAEEMNTLRRQSPLALTLAVDIPTGLNADSGERSPSTVQADATLAIGCVKPGMLAEGAEDYTGRLLCVPLPAVQLPESAAEALDEHTRHWLPRRAYSYFKNRAGRVRIIAGSPGYTGAAELCAEAALAAGAGLVELCCLPETYAILASRLAAEVMVRPVSSYAEVTAEGADALLIGPGLGSPSEANRAALQALVENATCPLVLDADGLNLAAAHAWRIPATAILTPHPGEMRRLYPAAAYLSRIECATRFVQERPCTLLLKGARSIITDGTVTCHNTTGGPFMANGGQGDTLAGVIAGFAAQGLPAVHAAALAAYECGLAATRAWAAAGFPVAVRASYTRHYLTAQR